MSAPLAPPLPDDLTTLSFQDLLQVKVTSVAKVSQPVSRAPAAIFVLRQEDLRRSGATSIPEALRLVPGVAVARLDSNKWAISIRGSNARFFNKLLVLIDGRSVYDPLHAGVYWDAQDTLLEDVDRIEVIRGPGATLWGANAVTGVINVITKRTTDTKGRLASAMAGSRVKALTAFRHGDELGPKASYRVWTKYADRDDFARDLGTSGDDGWQALRGGFRVDWDRSAKDTLTFSGDLYKGDAEQRTLAGSVPGTQPRLDTSGIPSSGGNALVRWHRTLSDRSDWTLQLYHDATDRTEIGFREQRETQDLDFQYHRLLDGGHDLVWGLGFRRTADDLRNIDLLSVLPAARTNRIFAAFVEDRVPLRRERLELTLGARFEHNDFTGLETQPTARLLWTPSPSQTWWAAVSRAVRTPSRLEFDLTTVRLAPNLTARATDRLAIDSEKVVAYDLGYRAQLSPKLVLDVALFYERFLDGLVGTRFPVQPEPGSVPPSFVLPFRFESRQHSTSRGFEVFTDWKVSESWKLGLGYSNLDIRLPSPGQPNSPNHQVQLRSYLDLTPDLELNGFLSFVERLRGQGVPSFFKLDLQLAWHASPALDLSLVGQDLLDDQHPEFGQPGGALGRIEVERGFYAKAVWHF
ncbi:MAG: TonB-dependent receptor [Candidatus Riflebacteria bacterium]|nr:TonB-dependent receptor [Candidatus Riflebacteria bacterium]